MVYSLLFLPPRPLPSVAEPEPTFWSVGAAFFKAAPALGSLQNKYFTFCSCIVYNTPRPIVFYNSSPDPRQIKCPTTVRLSHNESIRATIQFHS